MPSLLSLLALSAAWAAECAPTSAAAVTYSAEDAIRAFFAEDEATFTRALDALHRDLGCVDTLTADDAASIHLALALDALYPRDERALDAHLRAVLALYPTFKFTSKQAPPGGPLDRAMRAARGPLTHTPIPVAAPCGGALPFTLDGERASGWSGERAALVQLSGQGGEPTHTVILMPGRENPLAGVSCPTEPDGDKGQGFLIAGFGLGFTAMATLGFAAWNDHQADAAYAAIANGQRPGMSPSTLKAHATRANVASVAAIGLGLGGTTLVAIWGFRF